MVARSLRILVKGRRHGESSCKSCGPLPLALILRSPHVNGLHSYSRSIVHGYGVGKRTDVFVLAFLGIESLNYAFYHMCAFEPVLALEYVRTVELIE